ncbi:uncharacterized protein LTR77_010691 [Saxophila tyrrhenica]|uniref:VWFA domain-containing protein n=1 Tax=Saxophila tyrrhenica TaxID=1690608 RepID=A0AAV9NVB5_9PEZI|nr:hypothetical protein LTR77_010691 [Saxophila tyrrhenica]
MFRSLKDKLSPAKNNNAPLLQTSNSDSKGTNNHPQRSASQATRRPMNPPTSSNPFRSPGEAPPPYSEGASSSLTVPAFTQPAAPAQPSANAITPQDDDPYAFLSSFDTIFLIDDSGSMAGGLWRETKEALEHITPICTAHDEDGIDIYFLNAKDSPEYHNITNPAKVDQIFGRVRPWGSTPTGQKLNSILKPYLAKYKAKPDSTKPINIICITDGAPSDDVESPLIAAAKKLDKLDAPPWQIGIQFFQVGQDEQAKKHLKQLDDDMAEIAGDDELRDIVDTVPYMGVSGTKLSADGILKVVLGAVNRRLDRKKSKDLHR